MSEVKKLIPKRRFKEFQNAGDWEQCKLTDEVELFSGLTYSPNNIVKDNGTFVLRSSNVKNGEVVDADNVYVNSEVVNSCNVKNGDIIVVVRNGSRSLIGKHAQIKGDMDKTVIGAFMTGLRSDHSNFINALLDTPIFKSEIDKNLGATINQITNGMFHKMKFMIPKPEEQDKIGNLFTGLDNLITLHQRKLEKIKSIKKAYLYEMFPAEGESKPKRRFKGFTDDWEQRKLSELGEIITGSTPKTSDSTNYSGNFLFVSPADIQGNRYIVRTNTTLTEKGFNMGRHIREGASLFVSIGSTIGKVAQNVEISTSNQQINALVPNKYYNDNFVFSLLETQSKKIKAIASNQAVPIVNKTTFGETEVSTPNNIEEQFLIGEYFRNLDNLITIHQRKLDKLQDLKKAYLNEMFV